MNATETEPGRPAPHLNGELLNRVQQLRLDNQLGAAKSSGGGGATWLPWVLCMFLAGTWATVAIRTYRVSPDSESNSAAATTTDTGSNPTQRPPSANTSTGAASTSGTIQLEVKGYLVPAQQIAVSPIDVAGRIVELNIVEGKLFQKGDVLAKIEDTNYRTGTDEANASLAAAKQRLAAAEYRLAEQKPESVREVELQQVRAELQEADATKTRTADDLKRYRTLPGTVSAKELVQAQADFLISAARVERLKATLQILTEGPRKEKIAAAEADVATAQAEVKASAARAVQSQWRLDNCTIKAPITGTVLSKKAELGNLVNPLAFNASSGSVCDLADLSDLEVDLEIPERDISKLKVGQPCRIKSDAYPDHIYSGRLDRIMPIANRAKSIVNVRVKVQLPPGEVPGTYLKPEMGAVVSFLPMS